jgi:hypothetical protein
MAKQVRITRKPATSRRDDRDHDDNPPAADRREIRKDVRKVWWPDA